MPKRMRSQSEVCEVEFVDEQRVGRARHAMRSSEETALVAETFKVLGDPWFPRRLAV